ncbi:MAG: substrate-binding domain-containing protein [Oscillospiraceae bacterium]|nr:substrate-binding domain-containing protein [Oscillospiraceae bacterium]MCI9309129.1 substrate-binding domain-containing protein [Oscillospiraceae bacterium]MCI9549062.1 substrate-binding domain-containing protein [Oscillospiraceae bacterium]
MKRLAALFLALSMIFALAACGGDKPTESKAPAEESKAVEESKAPAESTAPEGGDGEVKSVEGKTVAFIPKLTGNAFFEVANTGAQDFAKDWGITVDYIGNPNATAADQVQCIQDAISKGVDAICISTVDAAGVADALKEAEAAGIVVCTWDSDAAADNRALMVSQGTPEVLGAMLVELAVNGLKDRGIDPEKDAVKYAWHYSQATVTDQNSWQVEGEKLIKEKYPNWENVHPDNYYSEQDAEKSVTIGTAVLDANPDIDLIICNDSTALPGQLEAAQKKGLTKADVTITGFATPNAIKGYCKDGILFNWGLWDCKIQGGLGCYVAAYIAAGNDVKVGDVISVPGIGDCEVMPNNCLNPDDATADTNNGVVLLPERAIFNAENMDQYDF